MKQRLWLISLISMAALLSGCGKKSSTREVVDTSAEDEARIAIILSEFKKPSTLINGWSTIKSENHQCQFALPSEGEFKNDKAIVFQQHGPSFSVEVSPRDSSISDQKYADDVEKFLQGNDQSVFSQTTKPADSVYCRSFAHKTSTFYQLARIYITGQRVYVLTSNVDKGALDNDEIDYFFNSFDLLDHELIR